MHAIDNWPPGLSDAVPPDGLLFAIKDASEKLAALERELDRWKREQLERRRRAWIDYHELNGWPADPEYMFALLTPGKVE